MRELVLHCLEAQAESLSDALLEAGVLSVSVEDAESDTETENPLFGEPGTEPEVQAWRHNTVVALLPDGVDPQQVLEQVRIESGQDHMASAWFLRDVPDADWVRLTQSQFGPIHIGQRIWIVPSWHREDPNVPAAASQDNSDPSAVRIELDPGLAFGTGSHPTTHPCLEWLESCLAGEPSLLDYGCGSGILAIAAAKLGAQPVVAVDIDAQAVEATRHNAEVNRSSLQALLPDGLAEGTFDVVMANILSNPLKILAPMLSNRVKPGGHLVLSGVLERQAQEVASAYAPWMELEVWRAREGWVCLHGRRP